MRTPPPDHSSTPIGENLRLWRLAKHLQQAELAEKIGMSAAQLCRLEKSQNTPSLRTLQRFAEALELPLQELMQPAPAQPKASPQKQASARVIKPFEGRSLSKRAFIEENLLQEPQSVGRLYCCKMADIPYRATSWQDDFPALREIRRESMLKLSRPFLTKLHEKLCEYRDLEIASRVPCVPSIPLLYPAEVITDDPEGLAKAMRTAGGIAQAVLFDSVAFFESKGIRVIPMPLPEGTESFTLWDPEAHNPFICLRMQSSEECQQFHMLTEIGWLARFLAEGESLQEDTPNARRFTRRFAAAFLMPKPALHEIAYHLALTPKTWSLKIALQVKQRFGVAFETFLARLEEVGLLQASLRTSLLQQKRERFGEDEPFPAKRSLVRHSRFSDLRLLADHDLP